MEKVSELADHAAAGRRIVVSAEHSHEVGSGGKRGLDSSNRVGGELAIGVNEQQHASDGDRGGQVPGGGGATL